jgi:uncharacterized protein YutE (UPF0331/DUF86 family)
MSNIDVIESKISFILQQLAILEKYKKYSTKEIERDDTLRGAVERYLYLATQASIDLAEAIVAMKDFRRPTSYSESFDILCDEGLISSEMLERLVKMTGFRNVIAHGYGKIDFKTTYDVLQNRLKDIEDFIKIVKSKLNI